MDLGLNDRVALVTGAARDVGREIAAQRDRVVASYTLLAAVGHLDNRWLGLKTPGYDPMVHYTQVRDVWHGLRTPDGR